MPAATPRSPLDELGRTVVRGTAMAVAHAGGYPCPAGRHGDALN